MAMEPIADQLNIETPELVSIEMPLAGIGSRFIAIVIDYLIWTAAFIVLILLLTILLPAMHFLGRRLCQLGHRHLSSYRVSAAMGIFRAL